VFVGFFSEGDLFYPTLATLRSSIDLCGLDATWYPILR